MYKNTRHSFDNMFREGSSGTETWLKRRNLRWKGWEKRVPGRRNSPGKGLEMLLCLACFRSQNEPTGLKVES